jgi:hypothetical protein
MPEMSGIKFISITPSSLTSVGSRTKEVIKILGSESPVWKTSIL